MRLNSNKPCYFFFFQLWQTFVFPLDPVWGRAPNKTSDFKNRIFIIRKQMFILVSLCVRLVSKSAFVSEENKTTAAAKGDEVRFSEGFSQSVNTDVKTGAGGW